MATLLAKKASGNNPFLTNDETPTQLETEYSDDNVISEVPNSTGVSPNVRDNSTVKHNMPTNSTQTVLTQSGTNTAQGADFVTNDNSDWINKKWRPVMGWVYMMT
jgi:methylmalonyl-CoA mutase N-terminal domain/subunit